MTTLSIGQFTALDVSVEDYLGLAAANGCQAASVLVVPPGGNTALPLVTVNNLAGVQAKLQETGLSILNVECLMLTPKTVVAEFRPALELGAALNAKGVTALIYDTDDERVRHNITELCAMASEYGLRVNLEFLALSPKWNNLQEVTALVESLAQPNLGLGVDLLHLIRAGNTPQDLAAVPKALIHYVQICDSADGSANSNYGEEAGSHRLAPGAGVFPVVEFLQSLPKGTPIEMEVPQPFTEPAAARLKKIAEASKAQIALAGLV
ncbi:sugar phosphate isomerase/epimerase family protein [Halioxenophilus sp. WMMB6]|uniref:sugar phosphate isomerase/epimerase family protein n=1 Tax=Halioxenophilus sp. WMMB6 TaxID=3073815 RepID=UPI00295E42FC|nr:TIM barrel protein [Halioxenophilus sp. WMMB6]